MSTYLFPKSMMQLINELSKLPSIGEKSALRLAYNLLERQPEESDRLANAIKLVKEKVRLCDNCFSLTEDTICSICQDNNRDKTIICVVEKPADVIALEKVGGFNGLYHVLHALWAPLRGITPEKTKIKELLNRIKISLEQDNEDKKLSEIILATSTTVEGDATALYIVNAIRELNIKVTRIAQGLPQGGELEYADVITLSHALERRTLIGVNE